MNMDGEIIEDGVKENAFLKNLSLQSKNFHQSSTEEQDSRGESGNSKERSKRYVGILEKIYDNLLSD